MSSQVQVATDFAERMHEMTYLFDAVLSIVIPWRIVRRFIEFIASIVMRSVYDREENEGLFVSFFRLSVSQISGFYENLLSKNLSFTILSILFLTRAKSEF